MNTRKLPNRLSRFLPAVIILFGLCIVAALFLNRRIETRQSAEWESIVYSGSATNFQSSIEIAGDGPFVAQVRNALALLSVFDPRAYAFLTSQVERIQNSDRSFAGVYERTRTVHLSKTNAMYSVTWCASALAHEAYHFKQWAEAAQRSRTDFQAAELEAFKYQISVMKRIRAPRYEIDYVRASDGLHGDVNGDGKYDWEDFSKINW